MQPDTSAIPHTLTQVLWLLLASFLGWTGAEVRSWLARRKREPVELARISAETRQITVGTDVSLMQAATEALSKALHLQDKCDLQQRQLEDLRCKLDLADENVRASALFVTQLNRAAKLANVNLSDYTPRQLKAPRALRDVVRQLEAQENDADPESGNGN